jgi:phosphohistidine phosphatase
MRDGERALTKEGAKKFRKAAEGFLRVVGEDAVSHVVSSPLVRARQTAEILAEVMGLSVEVTSTLAPGGELAKFVRFVHGLKKVQGVVAVGHEPGMSQWVGELCFGRSGRVEMKKGAVAGIELADAGATGELVWLMQPGALRKLE